jgi:hypothetical protein
LSIRVVPQHRADDIVATIAADRWPRPSMAAPRSHHHAEIVSVALALVVRRGLDREWPHDGTRNGVRGVEDEHGEIGTPATVGLGRRTSCSAGMDEAVDRRPHADQRRVLEIARL